MLKRAITKITRNRAASVELVGLGLLVAGAWMLWPPMALILAGLAAVVIAQGVKQ